MLAHFADAIRPQVRQISDESSRQLEDLVQRRRQLARSGAPYVGRGAAHSRSSSSQGIRPVRRRAGATRPGLRSKL